MRQVFSILGESAANPASGGMPPVQSTAGDGDDLPPLPVAGFGNVAFPAYARHQLQHPPPPQLANSPWESGAIDGDAIKSMQAVQAAQQTVAARARAMHCRVDGGVGSTAGMAACGGSGSGGAVLTKQGWTPEEDETIVRMVQVRAPIRTGARWGACSGVCSAACAAACSGTCPPCARAPTLVDPKRAEPLARSHTLTAPSVRWP